MKRDLIALLTCLAIQVAFAGPSLAEKNAAENAPFSPFRLISSIHYVGPPGLS